ncbi:hypothetical protein ACWCYY_13075 [Kitasatospora sp. NPDC001664]|uniref:hypothetical protein n=1 Tax=Kitasatospora albolonga TaxID=68173 RepID=UPI0035ED3C1B
METNHSAGLRERVSPVTVAHDGTDHVLGRPDLGLYVAVPEPGAAFVLALQAGASLQAATARAGEVAGEEVDGADFLAELTEIGLLDPVGNASERADGREIRWIEGISPKAATWFFGPVTWTFYASCALLSAVLLTFEADLRPSWESPWILADPTLSLLVFVLLRLALGAVHEAWHWMAARAEGVPAAFRLSHRGVFLVFETDISQIVSVPRRRRYGPILAGMAFDAVVLAVALGLRLLHHRELIQLTGLTDRLLGLVVLNQLTAIAWQWFGVFLRSDGYAVLANALRCHNLNRVTWLTVKRRMVTLAEPEARELASAGDRDRRVASWFALVYAVGLAATCWMVFRLGLPFAIGIIAWVIPNVLAFAVTTVAFWEATGTVLLVAAQVLLPPLLALRERRLRIAGVLR